MVVEFGAEVFFCFGERDSGELFKDVCEFYAALVDVVAEAVGNGEAVLSDVAVEGLHGLPGVAVPLEVGLVPVLFVEEDLVHGLRFGEAQRAGCSLFVKDATGDGDFPGPGMGGEFIHERGDVHFRDEAEAFGADALASGGFHDVLPLGFKAFPIVGFDEVDVFLCGLDVEGDGFFPDRGGDGPGVAGELGVKDPAFYVAFCLQSGRFPDDLREGGGMVIFPRVEGNIGFGYFRDAVLGKFLHAVDGGEAFE